MNKFVVRNTVTCSDIKELIKLDEECYKLTDRGSFEICKTWYDKNNKIYSVLTDGDEIVGYINFMPITTSCYNKIKNGKLKDYEITADDILIYENGKSYYCLFTSMVIKPEYQKTNALIFLLMAFYKKIKLLIKQGIKIKSIIADCVNPNVEEFLLNENFKQILINNNYKIYEGNIF